MTDASPLRGPVAAHPQTGRLSGCGTALVTPFRNGDGKPLANIGLVYRSQATLHLKGQFLANGAPVADARTTIVLPQMSSGAPTFCATRCSTRCSSAVAC